MFSCRNFFNKSCYAFIVNPPPAGDVFQKQKIQNEFRGAPRAKWITPVLIGVGVAVVVFVIVIIIVLVVVYNKAKSGTL